MYDTYYDAPTLIIGPSCTQSFGIMYAIKIYLTKKIILYNNLSICFTCEIYYILEAAS